MVYNYLKYYIDFSIGSCKYPEISQTGSDRLIIYTLLLSTLWASSDSYCCQKLLEAVDGFVEAILRYFKIVDINCMRVEKSP